MQFLVILHVFERVNGNTTTVEQANRRDSSPKFSRLKW